MPSPEKPEPMIRARVRTGVPSSDVVSACGATVMIPTLPGNAGTRYPRSGRARPRPSIQYPDRGEREDQGQRGKRGVAGRGAAMEGATVGGHRRQCGGVAVEVQPATQRFEGM